MTLREITLPEGGGISSSTAHGNTIDPQKAKASRRRRVEIQRLKTTCQNDVVSETNEGVLVENEHENEHGTCRRKERACGGAHGVVSVMGRRREMEDAITVQKELIKILTTKKEKEKEGEEQEEEEVSKYDYYGVYDGHGGSHVAEACRDRMHAVVREEVDTWRKEKEGCDGDEKKIDWEGVMERSFRRVDEEVWGGGKVDDMTVGSTAVVAVVGKEEIVVANCGDSRAVVFRGGLALPLSLDHKPDRPDELARIEAAGGRVINWYGFRVSGVLATSRSIGDYHLKPYVSSMPEVTISKRTDADEFLILASDGLWDVITNEVACQVVRRCLSGRIKSKQIFNQINKISGNRAEVAAVLLAELAIAKGSKDNISVIVVELKKFSRNTC